MWACKIMPGSFSRPVLPGIVTFTLPTASVSTGIPCASAHSIIYARKASRHPEGCGMAQILANSSNINIIILLEEWKRREEKRGDKVEIIRRCAPIAPKGLFMTAMGFNPSDRNDNIYIFLSRGFTPRCHNRPLRGHWDYLFTFLPLSLFTFVSTKRLPLHRGPAAAQNPVQCSSSPR